jgi:FAD/FMN-containing dehydrogenase
MKEQTRIQKIEETAIAGLRTGLRGELVQPDDQGYDEVRKVYNGMIDKRPALIVRAADAADVISAVNFARENEMLLAVRGGGHNGAGLGTNDGGLVIDLSPMSGVRVDPASRTVRVEGGATWGEVDHATHTFGLAVPTGIISSTGVGGLTLGGGHGYLTRKYGLTIDNLLSADVVLADGSLVTTSEEAYEDLFWAIRGGGGNFGVVTSFEFKAHPVSTIIGGPTLWPLEQAAEAMRFYRDFMEQASEDEYGFFAFLKVPPGPPFPEHLHFKTMCAVVWCYAGPPEEAEEVFRPAREFGPPAFEFLGSMPLPTLNGMFDALFPAGMQWFWKHNFVNELSEESISLYVEHGSKIPTLLSAIHLYPVDGAAHQVGEDETAFSYRSARWSAVYVGIDPDPANKDLVAGWAKDTWEALHPHSAGGAYVNMTMEEGEDRIRASYRGNYDRLVEVKEKYDPTNLFSVNQNIKPQG